MPNPYDDIFDDTPAQKRVSSPLSYSASVPDDVPDDDYKIDETEALDKILKRISVFQKQAIAFSKLLTKVSAIDYKVDSSLTRFFVVKADKFDQKSLAGERKYHAFLTDKFKQIIAPMYDLAQLHLQTVQQFNRDIDEHYYSTEKTEPVIKTEIGQAVKGINLQRKILADAANSLHILQDALADIERRIKSYINAGGANHISLAEYELLVQQRNDLTAGYDFHFDYTFFSVNLIDKTAISLGLYMKETTSQYMGKLIEAFEMTR